MDLLGMAFAKNVQEQEYLRSLLSRDLAQLEDKPNKPLINELKDLLQHIT